MFDATGFSDVSGRHASFVGKFGQVRHATYVFSVEFLFLRANASTVYLRIRMKRRFLVVYHRGRRMHSP